MKPTHNPSNQTTQSSLRYTSVAFIVAISLLVTLLMAACTATSVEEPDQSAGGNDDLVVTISPGDSYIFPGTRADVEDIHADHKLRYIATLYRSTDGNKMDIPGNQVQRTEQLASEGSQIIFKGVDPGSYFIIIFADYIDASASRKIDGTFDDKYYDTHTNPEGTSLKDAVKFNNHNLDCFLGGSASVFKKESNIGLEFTYTLKRMVSQIQVVANGTGSMASLKNIHISKSSVISDLDYIVKVGKSIKTDSRNLNIDIAKSETDQNLLFFFYTFNAPNGKALLDTEFTLNPNDGYAFANSGKYSIPGFREDKTKIDLVPEANYIYKITGNFLSTTKVPAKTVDLTVSVIKDWMEDFQPVPSAHEEN